MEGQVSQSHRARAWDWLGRVVAMVCAVAGAMPAMAQSFNEFPVPTIASDPVGIALGLDGNLWFTEFAGNKIGMVTPGGTFSEFPLPANSQGQSSQPLVIRRAPAVRCGLR